MKLEQMLENDNLKIRLNVSPFNNEDLIMIYGAITTELNFLLFSESYAHLGEDGNIRRFGRIIGTYKDIEVRE